MSTIQKLIWVVGCMSFFWMLEHFIPLIRHRYHKLKHATANFFLLFTTLIINALFGLATVGVFNWIGEKNIGLLHWIQLPIWLEMLIGIMLLDFIAQYVVHVILHKIKFLWRFHMVHHSDVNVDVTTGTRHHPGDYVFRELFALVAVTIGGIPLAFYMVYRILSVLFTYFSHANISLPPWADKLVSYVFISPNMHKFHHHFKRPWTDSNYGNMFSIWDRLFGTFVYADVEKIHYGLDVLPAETSDRLSYQLRIPFDYSIKAGKDAEAGTNSEE